MHFLGPFLLIFLIIMNGASSTTTGGPAAVDDSPKTLMQAYKNASADKGPFYYAMDGSCGVREGSGYVKPALQFTEMAWTQLEDGKDCLKNFHKAFFGPVCGDPYYEYVKHCAKVNFYENKLPNDSTSPMNGRYKEADALLVLLDGCAVCDKETSVHMELTLEWVWPPGSIFTSCSSEVMEAGKLEQVKLKTSRIDRMLPGEKLGSGNGSAASFVLIGQMYQRSCSALFGSDDPETSYKDVSLRVKHNCAGKEDIFSVSLPELVAAKHKKTRIVEMRGLLINLADQQAKLADKSVKDFTEQMKWNNWDGGLNGPVSVKEE